MTFLQTRSVTKCGTILILMPRYWSVFLLMLGLVLLTVGLTVAVLLQKVKVKLGYIRARSEA